MKNVQLQLTADGSHTLFNAQINETYHSHKGALAESRYVFIHAGMDAKLEQTSDLSILEIGFGTGLNTLLTLLRFKEFSKVQKIQVRYVTIEPMPLPAELVDKLNYKQFFTEDVSPLFDAIHAAPWEQDIEILPGFILHKAEGKLENYDGIPESVNLIYFDAFAPSKQADVWALANFKKCYELMQDEGLLVSYCANGQFKRDLVEAGFIVKPYPGALGKREMTRARKLVLT